MSRRLARVLSIGAVVLCVASVLVAGILHTATRRTVSATEIVVVGDPTAPRMQQVLGELERDVAGGDTFGSTSMGDYWVFTALIVLFILLWLGTGAMIVSRRSTNWAGWVFIITGAPFPLLSLAQAVMIFGLRAEPGSVPLIGIWATLGEYALFPVVLIPLLFLLYPDGHVPSPGWRWAVIALVGGSMLAFLGFLFRPGPFNNWVQDGILFENPLGIDAFTFAGGVIAVGTIPALAAGLSTAVAVVRRFRRSSGEERQQMRVLAFVAGLAGTCFMLVLILGLVASILGLEERESGGDWVFGLLLALTALTIVIGIPVAYLVAIFRYRLWDLDVVIKKTVVFAVVATGLTLLVLLVVLAVPVLTVGTGLSGWEFGLLVLGIVIGVLFGPLRRRARRLADRIVYRKRATPYEVLTAFSERIGETYSTEDVLPRMVQVLASGTGATSARVLLRIGSELREVVRWPEEALSDTGDEHVVPVAHLGEELGALAVRMPANDPMDPGKEKLVADLAAQTGLVLRNVRLIEDLRASRQRLVAAQDEERRKLERNIHDGAQQQLVALQVKQRLAEGLVERDPARAKEMLVQLQAETGSALEDLRDLARGIYPPLLADKGLAAALRHRRASPRSPCPSTPTASAGTRRRSSPPCTSARSRRSTTSRSMPTRPPSGSRCRTRTDGCRSRWSTTGAGSTPRRPAMGPGCRGWPTASRRSAANSRSAPFWGPARP
ncbi:MAG: histidine kinase [Actinobacteria bacterium]|nr:histidine kinase [Actinomycetota bacterium]